MAICAERTVIITGAGGVLCSAFSRALAADGHKIALLDLNLEAAEREAEGIRKAGGKAIAVQANVLDKESLKKAHDVVLEEFGPCEVLINGAGGNNPKGTTTSEYFSKEDMLDENARSFFDLDQDGVSFVFNLNFLGTLLTTQAFATDMLETGGCIVNISSMNAFTPLTKIPAYSGAKAAVSNFTQWLAVHFANCNIRVNAIAPGFFATNQNRTLLFNEDGSLTWEYPRGPAGVDTYMITLGPDRVLRSVEQVLTEAHYARIEPGMDEAQVDFWRRKFLGIGQ